MLRIRSRLFSTAKEVAYRAHVPDLFHRYPYWFSPRQLCFLCSCVDRTQAVPGSIVEIGCAHGHSTVFLNKHIAASGMRRKYVCIDTFSGFTESDVNFEIMERGKSKEYQDRVSRLFKENREKWFRRTLAINGFSDVCVVQADAGAFDYTTLGPVALCLIDVDLYVPVKAALDGIAEVLQPGGMVIVDDCMEDELFDGAYAAYNDFMAAEGLEPKVVLEKLGIIQKT